MKVYLASAWSDWGHIYSDERVKASSFKVAFRRAGWLAQYKGRKRPKEVTIKLRILGKEEATE